MTLSLSVTPAVILPRCRPSLRQFWGIMPSWHHTHAGIHPGRRLKPQKPLIYAVFWIFWFSDVGCITRRKETKNSLMLWRYTTAQGFSFTTLFGLSGAQRVCHFHAHRVWKETTTLSYSYSMVAVGFGVRSNNTRLTPETSCVIRSVIC